MASQPYIARSVKNRVKSRSQRPRVYTSPGVPRASVPGLCVCVRLHCTVREYCVCSQQEIRLDVPIEEESCRDLPLVWDLYRPIRASAAAILFDFNKRSLIYRNSQKEAKGACVWCVRVVCACVRGDGCAGIGLFETF